MLGHYLVKAFKLRKSLGKEFEIGFHIGDMIINEPIAVRGCLKFQYGLSVICVEDRIQWCEPCENERSIMLSSRWYALWTPSA
jgi:hypothetical protein